MIETPNVRLDLDCMTRKAWIREGIARIEGVNRRNRIPAER